MGSWKVVTAPSPHTTLTMLPLLLLSALLAAASGQAVLEPYMLGKFELESSNGFEDFMTEIGVGFLTRKVACALTPWPPTRCCPTDRSRSTPTPPSSPPPSPSASTNPSG